MQIEISDDVGKRLKAKAGEAGFDSVEAYLLDLVKEQDASCDVPAFVPYEQWREQYWAFVARQTSRNPDFDDSRESIYLGQ